MPLMRRAHTLQMNWCLECHGNPEEFVRDREDIYRLGDLTRTRAREHGAELVKEFGIDKKHCSIAGYATDDSQRTNPDANTLWRSLDELSASPEFFDSLKREFPRQAGEWIDPAGRRSFLKLMAARWTGRCGLVAACASRRTDCPVRAPTRGYRPGSAALFCHLFDAGRLCRRRSRREPYGAADEGRGELDHPASLARATFLAGAVLCCTIPIDRNRNARGRISTWGEFLTALAAELPDLRARHGRGLAILTETVTSPTLAASCSRCSSNFRKRRGTSTSLPDATTCARVRSWRLANMLKRSITSIKPSRAFAGRRILAGMPGSLRYAREFADRRRRAGAGASDGGAAPR